MLERIRITLCSSTNDSPPYRLNVQLFKVAVTVVIMQIEPLEWLIARLKKGKLLPNKRLRNALAAKSAQL